MEEWCELFNKGELKPENLRDYWKIVVPQLLSLKPGSPYLNPPIDESGIKSRLFEPLETFLFGCLWPQASEELRACEKPPIRCGKVFKVGEPTYSCRDCGADPTCVLCVDCFKTSGHQTHRYRMSTSGGGGYCDCGDTEAWRSGAFCKTHQESNDSLENNEDPLSRLPPAVVVKGRIVMEALVTYCYQLILWDKTIFLPDDLKQNKDAAVNDSYVTLLYNDEIHTYDQVIRALVRNINCSQKEAVEIATLVDREGRSVIRCSHSRDCINLKEQIEKFTAHHIPKPLRVLVMHADVYAHQNHALRLMNWLLQLVNHSRSFRYLFGEVVFREGGNEGKRSIVESIMDYDTKMWKSARSLWHQLFISGLLMEGASKQKFSRLYARNYSSIIKDFVEDDHEQTLSITSLSVQLFTVPSLAHMLIAEEDIIAILLHTFNVESENKLNSEGKLAFVRTVQDIPFKRACCVLSDLYYLVNTPPESWTGALRRTFLHGFAKLLELLSRMHGMDAAVRQVGQHVEFEPEWETAFNLHLRLGGTVTMMIVWCSTDRTVLIKAYRAVMKRLAAAIGKPTYVTHKVAEHIVSCIAYDVSAQPVSIHLPLCGLLAGLHVHLERHELTYDSAELASSEKPTPAVLMELPLRTQVMMAQVHAQMWRRNGYSLLNQIFFYRNVRYRTEIYDRDIVAIQMGASLMDANDFLIHVLNKFGLLQWVWDDYVQDSSMPSNSANGEEESVASGNLDARVTGAKGKQVSQLAEDFLGLIITVVGERYVKGVGQVTAEDVVKKEVIQQLSIEPMSHSQLVKALPEDSNNETGLERVIDQVAIFKKPPGSNKGLYELLPEAHKHFNPFFFHYSREEQSKAEEFQRKRMRDPISEGEDTSCLPPPVPPPFSKPFSAIINILCSDVMLKIMRLLLERALTAATNNGVPPTDSEIQRVLHLIGYALHEEQRSLEAGNLFFQFTKRATKENILELLEALIAFLPVGSKLSYQIPHRDLLSWTTKKFRIVRRNHASLAEESGIGEGAKKPETSAAAADDVDPMEVQVEKEMDEKQRRAELAMARRARIMAQMAEMQKSFISTHSHLFKGTTMTSGGSSGSAMDLTESEEKSTSSSCIGPSRGIRTVSREVHTCILCQEEEEVSMDGRPLVFSVLVQKSTVLCPIKGELEDREVEQVPLLPAATLKCALHTSTCGHVMHAECWKKYFEMVANKERRRSIRIRQHISFDVNKQEFLCPLCECLSNAVIPIIPPTNYLPLPTPMELSVNGWVELMEQVLNCIHRNECIRSTNQWPNEAQQIMEAIRSYPQIDNTLAAPIKEMLFVFAKTTYSVAMEESANEEDAKITPLAIHACFFTIRAIEVALRDSGKPTFGETSSRQSDALKAVLGYFSVANRLAPSKKLETYLEKVLNFIYFNDHNDDQHCFLNVDAFGLLMSLVFTLSNCYGHTGYVLETSALRFVYVFHALQIVASVKVRAGNEPIVQQEENNFLMDIFMKLNPNIKNVTQAALQSEIEQRSIPFLRCCALFFQGVTGVTPPEELTQLHSDEHAALCRYLALEPDVTTYIQQDSHLKTLAQRWISHSLIAKGAVDPRLTPSLEINQLCALPLDYSELINEAACFTCPNSDGEGSRVPTLCLICGHILCSQSYCCQSELNGHNVGACTLHANRCGAGVGMFLRIRECKVLLLASRTKGCFISPPYLDRYGETDQGLRRGNPLYLCHNSFKKLHRMWLNHSLMEEIAHSLESAHFVSPVEWQHL